MYTSLLYIVNYIRLRKIKSGLINDISQLKGFGETTWNFISSIYKFSWNTNYDNSNNNSFRSKVANKFTSKTSKTKTLSNSGSFTDKKAKVIRLSSPIPVCLSKEVLEKSKFFSKEKKPISINKVPQKQLYTQVASLSISDILKLKENYSNLLAKKIENIQKIIDDSDKSKLQIVPYINKSLFLWTKITLTNL